MVWDSVISVYIIIEAISAILEGNVIVSILAAITVVIIVAGWLCFYDTMKHPDV